MRIFRFTLLRLSALTSWSCDLLNRRFFRKNRVLRFFRRNRDLRFFRGNRVLRFFRGSWAFHNNFFVLFTHCCKLVFVLFVNDFFKFYLEHSLRIIICKLINLIYLFCFKKATKYDQSEKILIKIAVQLRRRKFFASQN